MDQSIIESLRMMRIEGNVAFLPKEPMTNYAQVKRVLQNAGGTYKKNSFVFHVPAQSIFDRLTGGEKVNPKKEFQQFFTPDDMADYIVSLAQIQDGMSILEPEAGDGQLIRAIYRKFPRIMEGPNDAPAVTVDYCEILEENKATLSKWFREDKRAASRTSWLGDDFLQVKPPTSNIFLFDRVIMNPPFADDQDIKHIRHAWEFVKRGGKLLSYCSDHPWVADTKATKLFRNFVESYGSSLPCKEGAFKKSGTMVKTRLVILNRP
jgi:predicted RNA methylase